MALRRDLGDVHVMKMGCTQHHDQVRTIPSINHSARHNCIMSSSNSPRGKCLIMRQRVDPSGHLYAHQSGQSDCLHEYVTQVHD